VISWFEKRQSSDLGRYRMTDAEYRKALESVPDIRNVLAQGALDAKAPEKDKAEDMLYLELLLEGLICIPGSARRTLTEGFAYRDMMSDILKG